MPFITSEGRGESVALFQQNTASAALDELRRCGWPISHLIRKLGEDADLLSHMPYGRVPADPGEMFEWTFCLDLRARFGVVTIPSAAEREKITIVSVPGFGVQGPFRLIHVPEGAFVAI